jgi:hypothetical protein
MRARLAMPALLAVIAIGFYWKLTLTDQYTWVDSPDFVYQVLPWLQAQAREVHLGRLPLWDPYEWGGHTLIGQAQPGTAYPLNWLLFALPLKNGFIRLAAVHWYYVLIHYLGALFCFLLCRDLKLSRSAALVGALVFGFGAWMASTDWPQMLNGAVWAPLVFLFLLRVERGEQPVRNAGLAGAFLGVALLSGHHQAPIYIALAAGGVWIYALARARWRLLPALAAFAALAGLVSALQTLPAVEYGQLALRWVGAKDALGWSERVPYSVHALWPLKPMAALGTVIPGLGETPYAYVGVAAAALALAGVAACWRERAVRLMLAVAVGGLLFAMGPYVLYHGVIYALAPMVDKARNASMAAFLFQLGVAVLAGYGVDGFVRALGAERFGRWLVLALAGFGAALFLLMVGLHLGGKPVGRQEIVLVPFIALAVAAVLAARRAGNLTALAATVLLGATALCEMAMGTSQAVWRNREDGWSFLPLLEQHRDVADFLRQRTGAPRVEIDDQAVPYNFGDWYGIEHFGGYMASIPVNIVRGLSSTEMRNRFAVRYSVGRKPARAGQKEVFSSVSGLKVYENPEAFPRAWSECADSVRLAEHTPNRILILASMRCRGMVIASEAYFPGWMATVDGQPAAIHEVYGALRGVAAPPGEHRIEMRYRPASVRWGAAGTLAGILAACGLGRMRRRDDAG